MNETQSDLRNAWNKAEPQERLAFFMEITALSKPHSRTFGTGKRVATNPSALVRHCVKFARKLGSFK